MTEIKAKVVIQIMLLEDDSVTFQSTSKNRLTSLGIMRQAEHLLLNAKSEEMKADNRIYRL